MLHIISGTLFKSLYLVFGSRGLLNNISFLVIHVLISTREFNKHFFTNFISRES